MEKPETFIADKKKALNKLLGYPDPPEALYAVGLASCAGIWWSHMENESEITEWEIMRYRRASVNEWKYKGSVVFKHLKKPRVIYGDLTNGCQVINLIKLNII
jgi:hypothetical protein